MFFIVIMIASMAAVGLGTGSGSNPNRPKDVEPIIEETPPPALTFSEAAPTIDPTKPHVAIIKTDKGDIRIDLATDAPKAVNSFAFLAGKGFYNDTAFFYVDHDFVAQAGDPTCKADSETTCSGVGGPGYILPIEPEATEAEPLLKHVQWAVSAPSLGQGSAEVHGSQFRILFQPDDRLDGQETVFGVISDAGSRQLLEGLTELALCSQSDAPSCARDLTSALVIKEVIVQPA